MNKIQKMAVALPLSLLISGAASAGLLDVKEIVITNSLPSYIQISEVIATEAGTGNDLALASAGATAFGSGNWSSQSTPDRAIDGLGPLDYPHMYHSDGAGADEFLRVVLAVSGELDSLTIAGRTGCCSGRDVFDVSIFDVNGGLLFSGQNFSAANGAHQVTINFDATGVPEPTSLALLAAGLVGIRFARKGGRNRE